MSRYFLVFSMVFKHILKSNSETSAASPKVSDSARVCAIAADELAELQDNTTMGRLFQDIGVPLLLKLFDGVF